MLPATHPTRRGAAHCVGFSLGAAVANAQIRLKQTKVFVGSLRYGVRHEVMLAGPTLLKSCFVIRPSFSPYDKERFVRVATLKDLVDGVIPVKVLNTFEDSAVELTAQQGDKLVFTRWPQEWGTSAPTFTVLAPDGRGLKIYDSFWWSAAQPITSGAGLVWELYRGGTLIQAGSDGWTRREGGDGLCLTDHFMAVFSEGETALNHMMSVQTYVNSLAESAQLDGHQFEQFAPGNPVEKTFPEA
jgi:hypothetical protein